MTAHRRRALTTMAVLFAIAAQLGNIASAGTIHIEVKGLAFTPAQITAHVGDTIEWVNDDFVTHTATAQNGAWDVKLLPHKTGRVVVKSLGNVAYYCRYHPNMKGEVAVAP
jgi:plastocyanin